MGAASEDVLAAWEPALRGNAAGQGPGTTFRPPPRAVSAPPAETGLEPLEPVGQGGMAVLYRECQRAVRRAVAVKQVRAELGPDDIPARARNSPSRQQRLHRPVVLRVHRAHARAPEVSGRVHHQVDGDGRVEIQAHGGGQPLLELVR